MGLKGSIKYVPLSAIGSEKLGCKVDNGYTGIHLIILFLFMFKFFYNKKIRKIKEWIQEKIRGGKMETDQKKKHRQLFQKLGLKKRREIDGSCRVSEIQR